MTTAAAVGVPDVAPGDPPTPDRPPLSVVPPAAAAAGSVSTALAVPFRRMGLREKLAYCHELADARMLPEAYRRQPGNVLFAVEYGEMLRIPPIAAITGIHVIEGKPTASAGLMTAVVRRDGHKLRVKFDKATMTATAQLIRVDDPSWTFESVWDLDRAVRAQLCTIVDGKAYARSQKGQPTSWEKYTEAMLKHRATSEVCRDGAEDSLFGVHYTPEEMGAEVDENGEVVDVEWREDDTPPTPPAPAIDWDAEIARLAAADDTDGLTALWKQAPQGSELRSQIAAAGSAAAARKKAAKDAEQSAPEPGGAATDAAPDGTDTGPDDDVVDADIVPEHVVIAQELMLTSDKDAVAALVVRIKDSGTGRQDVLGGLTEAILEVLGVSPDASSLTLANLAARVVRYVGTHGCSVMDALSDGPAPDAEPDGGPE